MSEDVLERDFFAQQPRKMRQAWVKRVKTAKLGGLGEDYGGVQEAKSQGYLTRMLAKESCRRTRTRTIGQEFVFRIQHDVPRRGGRMEFQ